MRRYGMICSLKRVFRKRNIHDHSTRDGDHMIKYALPELTNKLPFNLEFVRMMRSAPELFYDDIEIGSIYGNFPGCIMNGGRSYTGKPFDEKTVNETMDRISDEGVAIRLTFTNMLVRPEHFTDAYSNMILRAAREHNGQVIVNSEELAEYISDRYHLPLILSTTHELGSVEELNSMLERYSLVVLDYNHNKDDEYLRKVSDPSRLEVMPNELCEPGCPVRQKHYEHLSRCDMENRPEPFICPQKREGKGFTSRTEQSPTLLSNRDIRRLNETYGISQFKIVGRQEDVSMTMESYLYYLVRPEYHTVVSKVAGKRIRT